MRLELSNLTYLDGFIIRQRAKFMQGTSTCKTHLKFGRSSVCILIKECYSFINRFLVKDRQIPIPPGSNKLRISTEAFRTLICRFEICPSFVMAVSQHYLPSSQCSAFLSPPQHATFSEFWYLLPVRVKVECNDQQGAHATSPSGSNQMNPFHYLHLEDTAVDIRGSRIAIFFRYCKTRKYSKLVAVNFMDGRWSRPVEEPKMRIKESLESPQLLTEDDHFFPHVIYVSSVLRWWINSLTGVHDQLIIYVRTPYHPKILTTKSAHRRRGFREISALRAT